MPKIELGTAPRRQGTNYPPPYDQPCQRRERLQLGNAAGLTQFGVNLLRLPPGQWSSQRHWHSAEDEFVHVLEGEVVLVSNEGEQILRTGECAGFAAGDANGHHLQNRSNRDALLLEVGSRRPEADAVDYPDIDVCCLEGRPGYAHKDHTPY